MHKNQKIRMICSILLTFLLALSVFAGVFAVEVRRGWLNEERLLRTISSSGYTYQMVQQGGEELEELLDAKAVRKTVWSAVWDEEKCYRSSFGWAKDILQKGTSEKNDSGEFQEKLQEEIRKDLEENQVVITDAMSLDIEQTVKDAGNIYERCLYPSFLEKLHQFSKTAEKKIFAVMAISGAIAAVCVLSLWRSYHYKHHAMQYMAAGIFTAILWNVLALSYIGRGTWLKKSGIGPEPYLSLVKEFLKKGNLTGAVITGLEVLVCLFLCMGIRSKRKKA